MLLNIDKRRVAETLHQFSPEYSWQLCCHMHLQVFCEQSQLLDSSEFKDLFHFLGFVGSISNATSSVHDVSKL